MKIRLRLVVCVAMVVAGAGCRGPRPEIAFDSDATFAAHRTHSGIDVDRLPGGSTGVVRAPRWGLGSGPTFTLSTDGRTSATFWRHGPAQVEVRRGEADDAPVVGTIEPAWDDNAIRLTVATAGGRPVRTDTFTREGGGSTAALSRIAQTVVDVRGSYRAAVHDASGKAVGWLRVRISPYRESPRIYEGVLPGVDPALAVATAVALDSEIDWIEDHTVNVYRGTTGGPLQQSVPVGR